MKAFVNAPSVVAAQSKHQGKSELGGHRIQVTKLKVSDLGELCRKLEALSCPSHGKSCAKTSSMRTVGLPLRKAALPSLESKDVAQERALIAVGEQAKSSLDGLPHCLRFELPAERTNFGAGSFVPVNALSSKRVGDGVSQALGSSQEVTPLKQPVSVQLSGGETPLKVSDRVAHAPSARIVEIQGVSDDSHFSSSIKVESPTPAVSEVELQRYQGNENAADSEKPHATNPLQDSFAQEEGEADQPVVNVSFDARRGASATVQVSIEDEAQRVDLSRLEVDMKETLHSEGVSGVEVVTLRQGERAVTGGSRGRC